MGSFCQRVTIALAPLAALAAACTAFGVAPSSDQAPDPDGATSIADGGSEDLRPVEDGGDGGEPCLGATFCETFDTGSLDEIAARWDNRALDGNGSLTLITEGTRRAFQSRVANGREARLSRSLGLISPTTEVVVRAVVRVTPPTGSYELFTLDVEATDASFDDYEIMSQDGKLVVDGVDAAASVADGQWHTLDLHVTKTHIAFAVDGKAATGRALHRQTAEYFLRIGAFATSSLNATVQIDFIRVDVKP